MRRRCRVALSAKYMVWFEPKLMFQKYDKVDKTTTGLVSIACLHFDTKCARVKSREEKGREYSVGSVLKLRWDN